jgi:hypothetical protein
MGSKQPVDRHPGVPNTTRQLGDVLGQHQHVLPRLHLAMTEGRAGGCSCAAPPLALVSARTCATDITRLVYRPDDRPTC